MTVYVDVDHRVYPDDGDGRYPAETDVFVGMHPDLMACYKYYPANGGQSELVQSCVPVDEIIRIRTRLEAEQLAEENAAMLESIAMMVEEIYEGDIGPI